AAFLQPLLRQSVFRVKSERSGIVVGLWRETRAMSRLRHARGERQEGILAEGLIGRQRLPIHAARRCAGAESQAAQRALVVRRKRRQENARSIVPMRTRRRVAQAVIGNAVEDADRIVRPALHQIAAELKPDVTAWNEQRRQPAFGKARVVVRLQPLQSDWRLELANP